jgi:hypothetical protein
MSFWKLCLLLLSSSLCLAAQPDRISGTIDTSQMVTVPRSLHRKALPQYDQGPVEPSFPLGYVTLVMAPSPSQQQALDQLLAQQQDRSSPNYHKWLTPKQYAQRFGLSQNDVNKITAWLESQGFQILSVGGGRNSVAFSGTAAQIESAFETEIHRYDVNGEKHIANSNLLSVPAALNGVITGVRGLTDFHPKPMYVRPVGEGKIAGPHPSYTTTLSGNTKYFLAPGDLATIYDINPLYSATPAIDGTGQKLAIIGQTDVYLADINDFRSGFGLNPITGCTTNASGIVTACDSTNFKYVVVPGVTDPGAPSTCGDLIEADLDIEWSGAIARNAQIIFVNAPALFNSDCTAITNSGGVNAALQAAINPPTGPPLAPVISMSYGLCEADAVSMETELQQGNAEGVTIMNSSGDTGAAACDDSPPNNATHPPFGRAVGGLAVNYPASSPEVTGVGGTSIPAPTFYTSTYWNSNNSSTVDNGGSALSTLVGNEAAWNDDVAFTQFCQSNPTSTFCKNGGPPAVTGWVALTSSATPSQVQEDIWISSGGGGASNCYAESGTLCDSGFPQPTWQTGLKVPGAPAGVRYVPDVSLLASPDFPGYVICTPQNALTGSGSVTTSSCANGISTAVDTYFSLVGGTSASTPVFAGIVTLLNQYLAGASGAGLGDINPTLYTLAATPSNGAFHAIKSGDNDAFCQKNTPAGQPADVICPSAAVIGFSASNFDPTTGYNLVTGLGSVDANALALAWAASLKPDFALMPGPVTPATVSAGASASAILTISAISGSVPMVVNFSPSSCTGLPAGAGCSFNPPSVNFDGVNNATTTVTISTVANMALPTGAQTITIIPTNSPNVTAVISLTVSKTTETFSLKSTAITYTTSVGGTSQVQVMVKSSTGFLNSSNGTTVLALTYSCSGIPTTAEISCQVSGNGQPTILNPVTVSLVTTAVTTKLQRPSLGRSGIFFALLLPGLFGIVFLRRSSRGLRLLSLFVLLGVATLGSSACGGSSNSNTSLQNPGTPAGSYSITIHATTAGPNAIRSTPPLPITLVVSQ